MAFGFRKMATAVKKKPEQIDTFIHSFGMCRMR
jgi:hypothetical protein